MTIPRQLLKERILGQCRIWHYCTNRDKGLPRYTFKRQFSSPVCLAFIPSGLLWILWNFWIGFPFRKRYVGRKLAKKCYISIHLNVHCSCTVLASRFAKSQSITCNEWFRVRKNTAFHAVNDSGLAKGQIILCDEWFRVRKKPNHFLCDEWLRFAKTKHFMRWMIQGLQKPNHCMQWMIPVFKK